MAHYQFLVYSNALDGRDDEYNDWYEKVHLAEMIAVPGFYGASRIKFQSTADGPPRHRYLAIYDLESDNPEADIAHLWSLVDDGTMAVHETLVDVETHLCKVISPHRGK